MGTGRRFFRNQTLRSLAIEPLERRALLTTLPNGFAEFQVGTRLDAAPVSVQLAPDGRLFVTTDDNDDLGTITVVKNGQVLNRSAIELDIVSDGEQGMIGMVLDPNFENNQFIYVMYTSYEGGRHNRISRF